MPKISEATYRERRTHILNTARTCFATAGIAISIDAVCERAGISKGAFYGYFKSKDSLFEALARDHGDRLAAATPLSSMGELIDVLLEAASVSTPAFARVELDTMAYAMGQPALNAIFIRNADLLKRLIRASLDLQSLKPEIDVGDATNLLEAATLGAFLMIALKGKNGTDEAKKAIEFVAALLTT